MNEKNEVAEDPHPQHEDPNPRQDEKNEEFESPSSEIENLEREIEEQKHRFLRTLADFDNYKKRVAAEREEIVNFANEIFILEILPALDGFERALQAAEKGGEKEDLVKGVALIKKQFEDALARLGVSPIEAVGKHYNPHYHEAIMQKEAKDVEEGTVLEEVAKGFTFHGKTIRPSMVIVSK